MARIIIVSNRVDLPVNRRTKPVGGLAAAIKTCLYEKGGIWVGWSGKIQDSTDESHYEIKSHKNVQYITVILSRKEFEDYYIHYSNQTLWPLLHYQLRFLTYQRSALRGYLRVNQKFAHILQQSVQQGDIIWVHDYHLIPLGAELRRLGVSNQIGFFLHTPMPPTALITVLPDHQALIKTLLAYDVVGFQTNEDVHNFRTYLRDQIDNILVARNGTVFSHDRITLTESFPISIDYKIWRRNAVSGMCSKKTERLKESIKGRDLIMSVDRLDYSKGLLQRLGAYQILFENWAQHKRSVIFLQIAVLSRTEVSEYRILKRETESLVGRINGTFAEFDWVPIRYVNHSFTHRTLASFYRLTRIGLVTPLRDGMNLVAKEFVAAQSEDDPGVLILSAFAGAADELKNGALIVNPFDREALAEALHQGLIMSLEERKERWQNMMKILQENNVITWWDNFIHTLSNKSQLTKEDYYI